MAKEYIDHESFIADQRHMYCENCARRKCMKNGKMKFIYDIGGVPCRACDIGDMLDSIEDYYPDADVVPVRHGRWILKDDGRAHCSECDTAGNSYVWHFCPNCGARMDGDEE